MTEIELLNVKKAEPHKVLYIEDNEGVAKAYMTSMKLEFGGDAQVTHIVNHDMIEDFLTSTKIRLNDFDIIITDNATTSKGNDGKEWLEKLLKNKAELPPVVIVSGDDLEEFSKKNQFLYLDKTKRSDLNQEKMFAKMREAFASRQID